MLLIKTKKNIILYKLEYKIMAKCRFLGRSCIEIITLKDHIIIDPNYFIPPRKGIEMIFITHEHEDHTNIKKIEEIERKFGSENLEIVGPKIVGKKINRKIKEVKQGKIIKLKDLKVKTFALNCYKAKQCLAYLIYKGDIQLLHTADAADYSEALKDIKDSINYLFIACFEDYFENYYEFIKEIAPQVVFPYHFDPGEEESAKKLSQYLNERGIDSHFIDIGTDFEF
jgi:L-ascorbate metabolism protein UlaG (beta-lactamase superfamily)